MKLNKFLIREQLQTLRDLNQRASASNSKIPIYHEHRGMTNSHKKSLAVVKSKTSGTYGSENMQQRQADVRHKKIRCLLSFPTVCARWKNIPLEANDIKVEVHFEFQIEFAGMRIENKNII